MKPNLLLIPGMFNTAQVWDGVRAFVPNEFEVRVADVSTQTTIQAMAADAWQLLADLPADNPIVVCGFSMGGYVALEMLATRPGRMNGIALVDTSSAAETEQGLEARAKTIAAFERNFDKVVETLLPFNFHPANLQNSDGGETESVKALRTMMHSLGMAGGVRQMRAIMGRSDHRAMLPSLNIPALVVCGVADKVTPPELSDQSAKLIPGAVLEMIDAAGHMTPSEQPEKLALCLTGLMRNALAQIRSM
jgi:pimeloyl-ACP methyl ester carboxylesterase